MRELTGRGLGVAALLIGCGLATTVAPAAAAGFTISGTVRSAQSGAGVGVVCVDARDATTGQQVGMATSAGDGTYAIGGLPAGSYRVFFDPQCLSLSIPYTWQWWPGTADPNSAGTVAVQSDVPLVDAALQPGGSMSGTLTDPHGQPAAGVCVTVGDASRNSQSRPTRSTTSDASGHYSLDGLATAAYDVTFGGGCDSIWSPEYYPGIAGVDAQPVSVAAPSDTVGIDATVARLTTISGRLTWASDGSPIANACVWALDLRYDSLNDHGLMDATTGADGTYTFSNVGRGTYTVVFQYGQCVSPYLTPPEFPLSTYSATGDRTKTTPVKVDGDPITGIDMALPPPADVTGHVTGPDGKPLAGIVVRVWGNGAAPGSDAAPYEYLDAYTDSSGNYTVKGLPTWYGARVEFQDISGHFSDFWWADKPTFAEATPIDVTSGHVTTAIDAQLHRGAEIEGHVFDSQGQPVEGAVVHVQQGTFPPTATTDASGAWYVDGLYAGTFRVWAQAPGRPDVAARFQGSVDDPARAPTITLTQDEVHSGADIRLGPAGHIVGTVTDSIGSGLPNVCVTAVDPRARVRVGTSGAATTDSSGHYDVGGLSPGSYVVRLSPCAGLLAGTMYHGGAVVQSAAARVNVAEGETTDVGTDQLPGGGDITGTVTTAGTSFRGYVTAESDSGERRTVHSASDGSYRISGLTAGTWRVHFQGCPLAHSVYYTDSDSASGATPVTVTAGAVTSGVSGDLTWLGQTSDDSCRDQPLPSSVTATAIDSSTVLVKWTRPPDAAAALIGYELRLSPNIGFGPTWMTLTADDTEALVTGLLPGQYEFGVVPTYEGPYVNQVLYSQPVNVDSTPPTVALHLAGLTTASRASASWQGTDPDGVRSYDVQWTHRTIAGTLAPWSAYPGGSGTAATKTSFGIAPGTVYCLRVRATDGLGNVSAWSPAACTMRPVDDTAMHASSGWVTGHPRGAYLGTVHAIKARGATMTVSLRHVTTLYLLTYVCPSCGSVDIYVGRVRVGQLNLAQPARWTLLRVPLGGSRGGTVTVRTTSSRVVYVDGLGALDG